jgi:hypothetical protein
MMTIWRSKHVTEHLCTLNKLWYISIDLSFVYIRRYYCCVDGPICDILTHNRMHTIKIMIITSTVHGKHTVSHRTSYKDSTHRKEPTMENTQYRIVPHTKTPRTGKNRPWKSHSIASYLIPRLHAQERKYGMLETRSIRSKRSKFNCF